MSRPLLIGFGVVLTGLAGFVDALGFIRLGGLYTSLMSGNTTQLGVAAGLAEPQAAGMPVLLLGAFLLGSVVGGGLGVLPPERWRLPAILAFETLATALAFALALAEPRIGAASLFLALAMGAQNAALAGVQGFRAGTTFVTGALFSVGQKIALALAGRGAALAFVGDGVVWLALLAGAVAGTLAHVRLGPYALAVPPPGLASLLGLAACLLPPRVHART